jgi:threonine dehydrogenase-like Zn-dependent dehydrogenase
VRGLAVGQRVAALSYHAYAEYDLAEASNVAPLPPELDDQPFPGEALGCAMNVFRRADIREGQTVAIVGIGFLGAVLTSLAARAGARVIAITRRPCALEIATQMGAAECIALDDPRNVVAAVQPLTGNRGCERVIEAVGLQGPLDLAGELTAERGKLIIAGFHQDGPRHVNLQLWNWRGIDVINAHERDPAVYLAGMRDAIAAVASRRLDPTPLYTHRFSLAQLGDALDAMRDRDGRFMKALVSYE